MKTLHLITAVITAIVVFVALYWVTLSPSDPAADPCLDTLDLSAAAISENESDQAALMDNAVLQRGKCTKLQKGEPQGK